MRRALSYAWLLALFTVPIWLQDQYLLHVAIVTGIFIIAAMSLNLLLGYTGQLSLGHVGFFGIGAYASALAAVGFDVDVFGHTFVHDPWPVPAAFAIGTAVAGLCGYLIGKLSFRVRGAYFVIVTVSFAEVVRIVAVNWVDLTQGPLAVTNIPPFAFALPAIGRYTLYSKVSNYYLVLVVATQALQQRQRHAPMIRVDREPADQRARMHGGADPQRIREGKCAADEFRSVIGGDASCTVLRPLPAEEGPIWQCHPRLSAIFRQPDATGEFGDVLEVAAIQFDVLH